MGWREDLLTILRDLPPEISLSDLYKFAPRFHEWYPENRHILEKIRQTAQFLRDDGKLQFKSSGKYENLVSKGEIIWDLGLAPGAKITRAELASLLEMKSDKALRRGIFPRATGPYRRHIFVFHDEKENPYGDKHGEEQITYVGQGSKGDQKLTHFNLSLARHLNDGKIVHYFVQPKTEPGVIHYQGEVVVTNVERRYRADEERSVLEFSLVPAARHDTLQDYSAVFDEIVGQEGPPAIEPRIRAESTYRRVLRERAFRTIVLRAYDYKCAVCGDPLRKMELNELEGAHIVPVADGGPDWIGNGLSLCVRHHWAFDSGIFTLDEAKLTIVSLLAEVDPHGELVNGARLLEPKYDFQRPHSPFVAVHRRKWSEA